MIASQLLLLVTLRSPEHRSNCKIDIFHALSDLFLSFHPIYVI